MCTSVSSSVSWRFVRPTSPDFFSSQLPDRLPQIAAAVLRDVSTLRCHGASMGKIHVFLLDVFLINNNNNDNNNNIIYTVYIILYIYILILSQTPCWSTTFITYHLVCLKKFQVVSLSTAYTSPKRLHLRKRDHRSTSQHVEIGLSINAWNHQWNLLWNQSATHLHGSIWLPQSSIVFGSQDLPDPSDWCRWGSRSHFIPFLWLNKLNINILDPPTIVGRLSLPTMLAQAMNLWSGLSRRGHLQVLQVKRQL